MANNDAPGDLAPVQIFDDLNADQIEAIPLTSVHREVDTELVRADKEGECMSPMSDCELVSHVVMRRLRENPYYSTIWYLRSSHWRTRFARHSKPSFNGIVFGNSLRLGPQTRWYDRCWKEHLE